VASLVGRALSWSADADATAFSSSRIFRRQQRSVLSR
jgi:hypothetical protein